METTIYNGRVLSCKKIDNILVVWVHGDPLASFEVKRKENGDLYAYAFEGDFSVEEIKQGKKMYKDYEEV